MPAAAQLAPSPRADSLTGVVPYLAIGHVLGTIPNFVSLNTSSELHKCLVRDTGIELDFLVSSYTVNDLRKLALTSVDLN